MLWSILQQVHSLFQSDFSTECDLVLTLSIYRPFFLGGGTHFSLVLITNVLELHSESTFSGHLKTQAVCPDENPLYLLIRLHDPISRKTKISKHSMILRAFFDWVKTM